MKIGQIYTDKWGELWERINGSSVQRKSDGMIGGWYDGQGLTRLLT